MPRQIAYYYVLCYCTPVNQLWIDPWANPSEPWRLYVTSVSVMSGDITQVEAEGLMTAINSGGMWFGGIDGAIQHTAMDMFHSQAREAMPLTDGEVIFARAMDGHKGRYGSVLFVVDDLERPLHEIIMAGLNEAEEQKLTRITLPTIRTGVMAGVYEFSVQAALMEMVLAIMNFRDTNPVNVQHITIVVYNDADSERFLREAFV